MLDHTQRFLDGKTYRLDEEGIQNMLAKVKEEKGEEMYDKAKKSLSIVLDQEISIDDLKFYLVTCLIDRGKVRKDFLQESIVKNYEALKKLND